MEIKHNIVGQYCVCVRDACVYAYRQGLQCEFPDERM